MLRTPRRRLEQRVFHAREPRAWIVRLSEWMSASAEPDRRRTSAVHHALGGSHPDLVSAARDLDAACRPRGCASTSTLREGQVSAAWRPRLCCETTSSLLCVCLDATRRSGLLRVDLGAARRSGLLRADVLGAARRPRRSRVAISSIDPAGLLRVAGRRRSRARAASGASGQRPRPAS
jgi:hypothetical protein